MSCKECKKFYRSRNMSAPCDKCWPGVHWLNVPVKILYENSSDQVITAGDGQPVALSVVEIDKIMDYLNVPEDERLNLSVRVRDFARRVFEIQAADREQKMEEAARNNQ